MNLREYLDGLERGGATDFAEKLNISVSYLSQLASGLTACSPERCVQIERATDGAVSRRDLRPDDWQRIWPELADKAAA